MERKEIIDKLTPIAQLVFEKEDLVLTDELDATKIDTWTSLTFMHLLEKIEVGFGFKFKMMELIKLNNIGAIIDTIVEHC